MKKALFILLSLVMAACGRPAAGQLLFINALQWIVSNDPDGNPLDK